MCASLLNNYGGSALFQEGSVYLIQLAIQICVNGSHSRVHEAEAGGNRWIKYTAASLNSAPLLLLKSRDAGMKRYV